MSVLAGRPGTRILLLGLLIVLLAAATVVVGGGQSAQAFDCNSGDPKPKSCPFLKVEQQGVSFRVNAELLDPSGSVLYSWSENRKKGGYALWHWRWYGANDRVHLSINPPRTDSLGPKEFTFPANESHCYLINLAGVYEIKPGCNDHEDPPN